MKLKLTYKNDYPTGRFSSFLSKSIDVKLNGKKFANINEKSILDRSDKLNWSIQVCILNDKVENCKWRWWFLKQTFNTSNEAKDWLEANIEKLCETLVLWMIDYDKPFEKEIMRVRKICVQCRKLKSRLDYPKDDSHEGRGSICNSCISGVENEYEKLNSKIVNKNNPLNLSKMSLKEKREAAAKAAAEAAKKQTTDTVKKPVAKKSEAKVEEKKSVKKTAEPVAETKKPTVKKPEAKVETTPKAEKTVKPKKEKLKISQIDLQTKKVIKVHADVDAAAAAIGKHRKYIDICGKNGSKSAYGFKWLYEGYELPEEVEEEEKTEEVAEIKKSKSKKEKVDEEIYEEEEEFIDEEEEEFEEEEFEEEAEEE